MKHRMTEEQEFEILKMVLDKFLWIGFIVMGWGLFVIVRDAMLSPGVWYLVAGAVVLVLFMIILVKEYDLRR